VVVNSAQMLSRDGGTYGRFADEFFEMQL